MGQKAWEDRLVTGVGVRSEGGGRQPDTHGDKTTDSGVAKPRKKKQGTRVGGLDQLSSVTHPHQANHISHKSSIVTIPS